MATTRAGTLRALEVAARLARVDDATLTLVLRGPARSAQEQAASIHRYLDVAASIGVPVAAIVCGPADPAQLARVFSHEQATIVVGGRLRAWPGPEQRLARRLTSSGCTVVFAPC